MSDQRMNRIIYLYRSMPGASRVPVDHESGLLLWSEVEHTEHWQFAEAIVDLIAAASGKGGAA